MNNKTIMQFFEWYLPADCTLWDKLRKEATNLKDIGITSVWLPPAYKAAGGVEDAGYGVYDLYDLGEFNQKGTVPTKYGLKDQYIEAIEELHKNGIEVLADIVFNHKMGADVDLNNVDVVNELISWTRWYIETCNIDGFRLDAVKHIRGDFYKDWLEEIRKESNKEIFAVGEYWRNDVGKLKSYLEDVKNEMSLFDVPLHYNMYNASHGEGNFDMKTIFDNTLVKENPNLAVTFVDNHDTEPGQALESYIMDWFKPLAYSLILLRNTGIPCVFYGDYYGINHEGNNPQKEIIDKLLYLRNNYCYGKQNDYMDNENVIGWTLEGDQEHENSGLAVIMSDSIGGTKNMYIGEKFKNCQMYDALGKIEDIIQVDGNGNAEFRCNGGSVSVWIKK